MTQAWWQHRQWKFIADMNRDGALTPSDVWLWLQWLFFLPGDALIALLGPTALGAVVQLTPESFGTATSALLSVALWPLGVWLLFGVARFLVDTVDPTFYAERREAAARAQRTLKQHQTRAAPPCGSPHKAPGRTRS